MASRAGKRTRKDSEDTPGQTAESEGSVSGTLSRKEQNRISQEKSRAKKAEYVSTLEGEVRLLSYNKDAQTEALLKTIRVIMQENARLRTLVGNLSDFIGKGLGGLVSDLGLTSQGIEAIANEGYFDYLERYSQEIDQVAQKKQRESADPPVHWSKQPGAEVPERTTKSEDAAFTSEQLKLKTTAAENPASPMTTAKSVSFEKAAQAPSTLTATPLAAAAAQDGSNETYRGFSTQHTGYTLPGSTLDPSLTTFASKPLASSHMSHSAPWPNHSIAPSCLPSAQSNYPTFTAESTPDSLIFADLVVPGIFPSPGRSSFQHPSSRGYLEVQAMQLVDYHVHNHRRNPFSLLPSALERTFLQKNVSHDPCIDEIIWPSMRDKLISSAPDNTINPKQVKEDLVAGVIVHPSQDLLDTSAWELPESFVRKYPSLIDLDILRVCNQWRSARGDTPLVV